MSNEKKRAKAEFQRPDYTFKPILTDPGTSLHLWTELENILRDRNIIYESRRTGKKLSEGLNSVSQERKGPICNYKSMNTEGLYRANRQKLA